MGESLKNGTIPSQSKKPAKKLRVFYFSAETKLSFGTFIPILIEVSLRQKFWDKNKA